MYLANPRVRNIFYVLDSILIVTIEHLASKRLLCLKNSTILQVLTIHIECLMILTRFVIQILLAEFFDAISS